MTFYVSFMNENGEIRFHTDSLFTGDVGTIDVAGCTIRGVSVITGGQEAEGHGLTIDNETLRQLQACAKERGKIPVTLDHGSGIKDINGFLTGFRLDASGEKPKIRADWHLLETHPETKVMIEKAEKMPTCFGLSVAFKGPPKGVAIGNGKMAARCEKLLSVDVVTRPAANEGLFSVPPVDKSSKSMAKEKKETKFAEGDEPAPEPTLAQVLEAVQQLSGRLDQHEQILGSLQGEDDQPSLEEIAQMNDEELAQLGLTRAEVDAAVQEVLASMEGEGGEGDGGGEGEGGETGTGTGTGGEAAMAGAGTGTAAGATSGASAFKALQDQVVRLESKLKLTELRKKQEAEEVELSAIEEKVLILADQRDKAIKFAEEKEAENQALRLAVRTGTRPVHAGVDNGMRMFGANDNGELHEFQVRVKQLVDSGKTQGEAITFAQKENPSLHADWVQSQKGKRVA